MAQIDYRYYKNSAAHALPQHDGGIKIKGCKINTAPGSTITNITASFSQPK